ncbi:hypothetical protein P171DRAFT_179769 [Karstenula rhodostoma CBS 690.94]|uniref:Ankyrin n=1 Tax=Karstenula rhodostoma CBS 690.94 TaxID=1392251 RepID=A0A9P4P5K5_9PLEO|nr:hypothetical protein P171DRAFT_179769 [Karstenula rhodostoma CBS 690.94]
MLTLFLHSVESSQIKLTKAQLQGMLFRLVLGDPPPLCVIETLLDLGTDPNFAQRYSSRSAASPLSAAILRGKADVCDLLLERGADIRGVEYRIAPRMPLHYPIIAAANVLSTQGPDMMNMCLRQGADINQRVSAAGSGVWQRHETTAIDWYLNTVQMDEEGWVGVEKGLRFLLDKGASLDRTLQDLEVSYQQSGQEIPVYHGYVRRPSSLQILVERLALVRYPTVGCCDRTSDRKRRA